MSLPVAELKEMLVKMTAAENKYKRAVDVRNNRFKKANEDFLNATLEYREAEKNYKNMFCSSTSIAEVSEGEILTYIENNPTKAYLQIAKELGVSHSKMYYLVKKNELPARFSRGNPIKKPNTQTLAIQDVIDEAAKKVHELVSSQ